MEEEPLYLQTEDQDEDDDLDAENIFIQMASEDNSQKHPHALQIVSKAAVSSTDYKSSTACSNYKSDLKENHYQKPTKFQSTSQLNMDDASHNLSSCYSSQQQQPNIPVQTNSQTKSLLHNFHQAFQKPEVPKQTSQPPMRLVDAATASQGSLARQSKDR